MNNEKRYPNGAYDRKPRRGETRLSACLRLWEPVRGSLIRDSACGTCGEPGVVVDYRYRVYPARVPEDIQIVTLFRSGEIRHYDLERFHRDITPQNRHSRSIAEYRYVDDEKVNADYHAGHFDPAFADTTDPR